jgi:cytoskeletal protein CcmA (bactofilin family)
MPAICQLYLNDITLFIVGFFNSKPKQEPIAEIEPQPPTAASANPVVSQPKPNPSITQTVQNNNKPMNENATIISAGTVLEGQIRLEGDITIEGTIKGTVTCKSRLVLGPNGKVDGDVNCQNADISGKVMGKINVVDVLFLKGNALIDGDISTGKLVMESGVKFNGKCSMGVKSVSAQPNTIATPPANSGAPTSAVPSGNAVNA